jgi:hypothetical protein
MSRRNKFEGVKFGLLTAVSFVPKGVNGRKKTAWLCRCDCGVEKIVDAHALKTQKSCGCRQHPGKKGIHVSHGMTGTRLYSTWSGILNRTHRKMESYKKYYWGLGVSVCEQWLNFENFKSWAISSGYTDDLQIDRFPNPHGNYEPLNCRWATRSQQQNNHRDTKRYDFCGKLLTKTEASREFNVSLKNLHYRMGKLKLSPSESVTLSGWGIRKKLYGRTGGR